MKVIDISQEVLSCSVYPDDPAPKCERIKSIQGGECYNLSTFSMCAHNGTHIDAPFHFIDDGKTVDELPCDSFVGNCYVVHHEGDFTADDARDVLVKARKLNAEDRILIAGSATVTAAAAEVFAKSGIKLIGNEGQTVGPEESPMEVHRILLGAEIVLLEGIVLKSVPEGKYFLSALPLNISGFDGSPCRAYLIKEDTK